MDDVRNIPGYRFLPTDQELIKHYLLKKQLNQPLPLDDIFIDRDPYADSPWKNFAPHDPWQVLTVSVNEKLKTFNTIYVFTTLKKVSKKRTSRTAGIGTWHGGTKSQNIYDNATNDVIGMKKSFLYEVTDESFDCRSVRGGWYMDEFSLAGINGKSDLVLCKIKRDDAKSVKRLSERVGQKRARERKGKKVSESPHSADPSFSSSSSTLLSSEGMAPSDAINDFSYLFAGNNQEGRSMPRDSSHQGMATLHAAKNQEKKESECVDPETIGKKHLVPQTPDVSCSPRLPSLAVPVDDSRQGMVSLHAFTPEYYYGDCSNSFAVNNKETLLMAETSYELPPLPESLAYPQVLGGLTGLQNPYWCQSSEEVPDNGLGALSNAAVGVINSEDYELDVASFDPCSEYLL